MQSTARRVRVSASTSNLGPGFDLVGLALDRFLEVELRANSNARETALVLGEGCEEWPAGNQNLLVQAFSKAARARNIDPTVFELSVRSEIPVGRGMGSSGAARVAAVLLADSLLELPASRNELLEECIALEGHPDNATPALFGGLTLSFLDRGRAQVIEENVHESLGFALAWPDAQLETEQARRSLPQSVDFADALENPRRLAFLLEGLRSGDPRLIQLGSHDRLHERYRLPLIRGGREALESAREAGAHAAVISGSGSGMFAICRLGDQERIAAAMVRGFESAGARAIGEKCHIVRDGPRVITLG